MNKTHTLAISALALVTLVAWATTFAATTKTSTDATTTRPAMMGQMKMMDHMDMGHGFMPGMMMSKDDAVQAALKANDYDAFIKALTAKLPTKEQFATIVAEQAKHQAVEDAVTANDYDAFVKAITAMQANKSNNGKTMPTPTKEEFAKMVAMHTQQAAIQKAIDANDYNAFVTVAKGSPLAETITTQEKFTQLVQFHTAMKNNDTATLQKLKDAWFTPPMMGEGKGNHMRWMNMKWMNNTWRSKGMRNQNNK